MLNGKLGKLRQWTNNTLSCLPLNSSFQLGGSSSVSNLYKSIQFRVGCPSSCSASTCGTVDLFTASANVNLGNSSFPYSYELSKNKFSIYKDPKYQVSYQIDSNNLISDESVLPYSLKSESSSGLMGKVVNDVTATSGDLSNYITIERSDKTTVYMRSYYKLFDLVAYLGGLVYGIMLLLFFIRNFSRIEFELNFASECFRMADSKAINFRAYLKQLLYQLLKFTKCKPDWRMA